MTRQVQIACDMAKGVLQRVSAGLELPNHEDTRTDIDQTKSAYTKTLAFIESVDAAKIEATGPFVEPPHGEPNVGDMNMREALALAPICVLCLWIGVKPQPLLDTIKPDVDRVAALYAHDTGEWAARPAIVKQVHLAQE